MNYANFPQLIRLPFAGSKRMQMNQGISKQLLCGNKIFSLLILTEYVISTLKEL